MKNLKFKLLHSYRNISAKKGSSLIIIFTLSLLIMILILSLSMYSVLKDVFVEEAKSQYLSVDIVISYDENSSSRFINTRSLLETYDDEIISLTTFININTLFSTEEAAFYAQMMAGIPNELEQLIDENVPVLSRYDIVITDSLAENYHLEIGDEISFKSDDNVFTYQVKAIISDKGVFSGNCVFVLKETIYEDVFSMSNLENIGNVVYIQLSKQTDVSQFYNRIIEDPIYMDFNITETINYYEIERASRYDTLLFFGISLMMLVALFFVMYSLFLLFFKDFKKEQGIILSLGGSKQYLKSIFFSTLFLFVLFSSVLGSILSLLLLNLGVRIYGVQMFVYFPIWTIFVSLGITFIIIIIYALIFDYKLNRLSSMSLITEDEHSLRKPSVFLFIFEFIILLVFLYFKPLSVGYNSIIVTLLSFLILFSLYDVIIYTIHRYWHSKSFFGIFQFKSISLQAVSRHSFRVMLVIFFVVYSVITVRNFIYNESKTFEHLIVTDYAILGIHDYDSSLLTEFEDKYEQANVNEAIVYQDSYLHFEEDIKRVRFSVSMDYEEFHTLFPFEILSQNQPFNEYDNVFVVLPYSLKYIYDVEVGDSISIDFSKELLNVNVEIAGFFDTNFDNIIYTNIYEYNDQLEIEINTLFVSSNQTVTLEDLIEDYASKLYYIVDMQDFMHDFTDYILRTNNLFMFLSGVLVLSFIIVIINNTLLVFDSKKSDYAKLLILGIPRKKIRLGLLQEYLAIVVTLILFTLIESIVFTLYFPKMMLVFNYYKEIIPTFLDQLYTDLILGLILFVVYLYFDYKVSNLQVVSETKK